MDDPYTYHAKIDLEGAKLAARNREANRYDRLKMIEDKERKLEKSRVMKRELEILSIFSKKDGRQIDMILDKILHVYEDYAVSAVRVENILLSLCEVHLTTKLDDPKRSVYLKELYEEAYQLVEGYKKITPSKDTRKGPDIFQNRFPKLYSIYNTQGEVEQAEIVGGAACSVGTALSAGVGIKLSPNGKRTVTLSSGIAFTKGLGVVASVKTSTNNIEKDNNCVSGGLGMWALGVGRSHNGGKEHPRTSGLSIGAGGVYGFTDSTMEINGDCTYNENPTSHKRVLIPVVPLSRNYVLARKRLGILYKVEMLSQGTLSPAQLYTPIKYPSFGDDTALQTLVGNDDDDDKNYNL
jgi:hypothetical protein